LKRLSYAAAFQFSTTQGKSRHGQLHKPSCLLGAFLARGERCALCKPLPQPTKVLTLKISTGKNSWNSAYSCEARGPSKVYLQLQSQEQRGAIGLCRARELKCACHSSTCSSMTCLAHVRSYPRSKGIETEHTAMCIAIEMKRRGSRSLSPV